MKITMPAGAKIPQMIWLGDTDPEGNPLHGDVKAVAYEKVQEITRYRARELPDKAEVSSLFEEAAYRTSKAASKSEITNLAGYLWRTYKNIVDQNLGKAIKLYGLEEEMLAQIASQNLKTEDALIQRLTCAKLFAQMDEKNYDLWVRHMAGYTVKELAQKEGQKMDYVGKRLRRAIDRALRRLMFSQENSVGDLSE